MRQFITDVDCMTKKEPFFVQYAIWKKTNSFRYIVLFEITYSITVKTSSRLQAGFYLLRVARKNLIEGQVLL